MFTSPETLTRRRLVELGAGGYLGLNLGGVWRAAAADGGSVPLPGSLKPLKSCVLVFYYGGPSHLDTYDLKPHAPLEVRGEFQPISTSVPGLHVCEHLPKMARQMHRVALVRSVTHQARLHDSASIHALTGRPLEGPDRELFAPQPQTYPSYGSAVAYLRQQQHQAQQLEVPFASLPFPFRNVHEVPCQGGGLVGSRFDPLCVEVYPEKKQYQIEMLRRPEGLNAGRQLDRKTLLESLDRTLEQKLERRLAAGDSLRAFYEKAYRLLDSERIRQALDIAQEPAVVRERYGFGTVDPATANPGEPRAVTREPCAGRMCCSRGDWSKRVCRSSTCMTSDSRARTGTLTRRERTSTRIFYSLRPMPRWPRCSTIWLNAGCSTRRLSWRWGNSVGHRRSMPRQAAIIGPIATRFSSQAAAFAAVTFTVRAIDSARTRRPIL